MFVSAPKDCFINIPDEDAGNEDTTCPSQLPSTTVTASYAMPNVSLMPCMNLPSMDSSSIQDAAQPRSNPSPGLVAAIILGIVLVILVMACAVGWVVCFKRKKRRLKADRNGTFHEHAWSHVCAVSYRNCLVCTGWIAHCKLHPIHA